MAKVRSPKNPLFSEQNRNKWGNFFRDKAKDLLKWGFAKNSSREILILYDRCTSIVRIYAMKEVLSKLSTEIRFIKGVYHRGMRIFSKKRWLGIFQKQALNIPEITFN